MKCPNCGAPISGETCAYCGTRPAPVSPPAAILMEKAAASRGKRNLLDKILITLGSLWCLLIFAVVIDLGFRTPVEWTAGLIMASPGIVLLLIGFRRKKS